MNLIEVKVDTTKFDRILSDLPNAMARARRKALFDIGAEVVSQADLAFKHPHRRPSPWAPRKSGGDWPLLVKHPNGGLKVSIKHKLVGDDTVVVGTDKEYAGYHQYGTKHMPARPFMPLDREGNLLPRVQRKVVKYVEDALSDELRGIGFQ